MKLRFYSRVLFIGGLFFFTSCSKHYEARFPIDYVPNSGQPRTEVTIENHSYPFVIDLGDSGYLSISSELLKNLQNKERCGSNDSIDMRGNKYHFSSYILPEVQIRNIHLRNVEVNEEDINFLENTVIYEKTPTASVEKIKNKPGRIGRRLFVENNNLLLDFHNSVMFACCHLKHRIKDGYQIDRLIQIPFGVGLEEGIFLTATTDLGPKTFMLDTGATHSCIKPSLTQDQTLEEWAPGIPCYCSSHFIIGKKEFGPQNFILFEMAPAFENIDGILGMDFFRDHVVYLDFEKKICHIGKASEVSSNIRVPSYVKQKTASDQL